MKVIKSKETGAEFIVLVSPEEAVRLIKSLSNQIIEKSPNIGREEFVTEGGEYFTIAVEGEGDTATMEEVRRRDSIRKGVKL